MPSFCHAAERPVNRGRTQFAGRSVGGQLGDHVFRRRLDRLLPVRLAKATPPGLASVGEVDAARIVDEGAQPILVERPRDVGRSAPCVP